MADQSRNLEIAGFDLGHGESALALAMENSTCEPKMLEVQGERSFITAVAEHPTKGVLIGEEAYTTRGAANLRICFKSPDLDRLEVRQAITRFVGRVFHLLVDERKLRGDETTLVVIGCPSGWEPAARLGYEQLLRGAGIKNIKLTAESRAAFVAAKEEGRLGLSRSVLLGSVLIIDIGSSTTDFTAVLGLKERYIDFGDNRLGASLIEQSLLERTLAKHARRTELDDLFRRDPSWCARCELRCRKVKEMYFTREAQLENGDAVADVERISTGFHFDVELSRSEMQNVLAQALPTLHDRSWPDAFREDLLCAKQRLAANPPKLILLTGGASRMGFVLRICEEEFPEARIVRGAEPEFTIARGLAWAGRIDLKTAAFREELQALVESGAIIHAVKEKVPDLYSEVAGGLASIIPDKFIVPIFMRWQKHAITTLAELEPLAREQITTWLAGPEGVAFLQPLVAKWFEGLQPSIESLTDPLCDRFDIDRAALWLPSCGLVQEGVLRGLFDSSEIAGLDQAGNAVVGVASVAALVAILHHAIIIGIFHPVGWIFGIVAGVIFMFVGKARTLEALQESNVPSLARHLVSIESVKSKLQSHSEGLRKSIMDSLMQDSATLDRITSDTQRAIGDQLTRVADVAELLIR